MSDWVLNRWKRYGHDRLYAETPDGARLGYLDLTTNELHPSGPADLPLLMTAMAAYFAPDVRAASNDGPIYVARHEVVDWDDLSRRAPGQAVHEIAVAEREAAPLRTAAHRVLGIHDRERAHRIGAAGERAVAAQLTRLGPAWHVVNSVPVGERGSDIDHVVIGPGGVFTVNAKHHPDANVWVGGNTVLVNGQRKPYVPKSRSEASRASRLLKAVAGRPVEVRGIIAIVGARKGLTIKEQPRTGTVHVVAWREIADYLAALPVALSPSDVEALHDLACRSTTWRPRD